MADITYRTMQAADIPAALALWRTIPGLALDAADEPAALAAFLARNPGLSDIALADGAIIATLLCGEDGRRATRAGRRTSGGPPADRRRHPGMRARRETGRRRPAGTPSPPNAPDLAALGAGTPSAKSPTPL